MLEKTCLIREIYRLKTTQLKALPGWETTTTPTTHSIHLIYTAKVVNMTHQSPKITPNSDNFSQWMLFWEVFINKSQELFADVCLYMLRIWWMEPEYIAHSFC